MSFLMYETSWRDLGGPWLLNPDNRVGVNKSTCQKISLKRDKKKVKWRSRTEKILVLTFLGY